jgi:hypothetical protein
LDSARCNLAFKSSERRFHAFGRTCTPPAG